MSIDSNMANQMLYGDFPKLTTTIAQKRVRFSEYCWRTKAEIIHKHLFQEHTPGKQFLCMNLFIEQLIEDNNLLKDQLQNAVKDYMEKTVHKCDQFNDG